MFATSIAAFLSVSSIARALIAARTRSSGDEVPSADADGTSKTSGPSLRHALIMSAIVLPFAAAIDYAFSAETGSTVRLVVQIVIVAILGLAGSFAWFGVVLFCLSETSEAEPAKESSAASEDADDREGFAGGVAIAVILTLACLGLAVYFWVWN